MLSRGKRLVNLAIEKSNLGETDYHSSDIATGSHILHCKPDENPPQCSSEAQFQLNKNNSPYGSGQVQSELDENSPCGSHTVHSARSAIDKFDQVTENEDNTICLSEQEPAQTVDYTSEDPEEPFESSGSEFIPDLEHLS